MKPKVINTLSDGRTVKSMSEVTLPAGHPAYKALAEILVFQDTDDSPKQDAPNNNQNNE